MPPFSIAQEQHRYHRLSAGDPQPSRVGAADRSCDDTRRASSLDAGLGWVSCWMRQPSCGRYRLAGEQGPSGRQVDRRRHHLRGGESAQGAQLAEMIMEDVPCHRLSPVLEQLVQCYSRKSASSLKRKDRSHESLSRCRGLYRYRVRSRRAYCSLRGRLTWLPF
jgi:hypothetical protein